MVDAYCNYDILHLDMSAKLILGTQWGDEGKAKFIDYLSETMEIIVRFQGGANAGHTVEVGNKRYIFHLIPSGILWPNTTCVLGNGMSLDLEKVKQEIEHLESKQIPNIKSRIIISDAAHIVLPLHKQLDELYENHRNPARKIGTTLRGIGNCYTDKVMRHGIRVGDLLDPDDLKEALERNLEINQLILDKVYKKPSLKFVELYDRLSNLSDYIRPMVQNTSIYLDDALKNKRNILLEGAQGTGLDLDFGSYPYVTSSNTTTGGAIAGTGIRFQAIEDVIGITKAYLTRVGLGPMPTELFSEDAEKMRHLGREYGATTGRPRRCGWFDVEPIRHSVRVNGLTQIALTKLDILSHYEEIKIATSYFWKGEKLKTFPKNRHMEELEVKYETFPGWQKDISSARTLKDLPSNCRTYVERIEELLEIPITFISVGPKREETIVV